MNLQVGKAIFSILSNDADLVEKVENKIYPLIADVNTTFPFIVYRRNGIEPLNSKDRFTINTTTYISIVVASDKYDESIEIAERIIKALSKGIYQGIMDISLVDADEDYIDDTFIQTLTYNIKTDGKYN